jgi:hypothetical protein
MKNNAATAMPFPLFHPEDKHLMLRLKDTFARRFCPIPSRWRCRAHSELKRRPKPVIPPHSPGVKEANPVKLFQDPLV